MSEKEFKSEFEIGGTRIPLGARVQIEIPVIKLYSDTDIHLPITVIRAKKPGPTMFVSAAVHGDELNGIEILRRLVTLKNFRLSRGTLILVHMVNVYGVLNQSRYMPDRRDLNRSFPGSTKGSLAGRVASTFLKDVVSLCDYGIDLHTGAIHRSNLPQIRADLDDQTTRDMAESFGVPVLLNSGILEGSLRQAAVESGTRILLYEAGEALRFDEFSIRAGLKGILNVLSHLGMTRTRRTSSKKFTPFTANNSAWVRGSASGIVHSIKNLGDYVQKGDVLAEIGSPFGEKIDVIVASRAGIIIGKQNIPLVHEGDAMYHIAFFSEEERVARHIEMLHDTLWPEDDQG